MPRFQCEMKMPDGQVTREVTDAPNAAQATQWARNRGGYVMNVTAMSTTGPANLMDRMRSVRIEAKPGLKDVMAFTKQLAVMIKAGISIRDAIEGIASQVKNQRFRKILEQLRADVESGTPFSDALARHPKTFSPLYINMVRASEMSGTFAHMLERIVDYLDQQAETRRMVRGAMIYPAVLFTMSIAATTFLLTWVLPRFMKIFEGKEDMLPKPTVMLLALSDFLRFNWYFIVAGLLTALVGFIYMLKTPKGRELWDRFKLRVPIFRSMLRALYITRSLQAMGELVNAGVPILNSLHITSNIAGNCLYLRMWERVRTSVKEGNKIVQELRTTTLLPSSVVQMIAAGEESGKLGDVLADISEFYGKELRATIKAVTALIEPIMIVFMGFVVGFIAMSIILPVFKMSSLAGQ